MRDGRTEAEKVKNINSRLTMLQSIRYDYEPMWDDIIDFVVHYRRSVTGSEGKGKKTGEMVYDGTALSALNLLSDGLHGYLVSPSIRWFSLGLPNTINFPRYSLLRKWNGARADEIPEIKRWLEASEEVIYAAFMRSNFYEITPSFFRDGASIGTAGLYRETDIANGRTVYQNPHIRECYIARNKDNQVDTMYRKYPVTHKQLRDKFGEDVMMQCDPLFKNKYERTPYEEVKVIHAVEPRSDYGDTAHRKDKKFASYWLMDGNNKLIDESGYDVFPWSVWCWYLNSDEWYGRSPAWDAYVEIMKLNQMAKDNLEGAQMSLYPPYVASSDLRGKLQIKPKGRTWVDRPENQFVLRPLMDHLNGMPVAVDFMQRAEKAVKEFFHVDFFLMLSEAARNKTQLTATQVIEMSGEKAAILGTRIGRLQSEFLNPEIDIMFDSEMKAGRIPPIPEILMEFGGTNIEVDYLGPLATVQKKLFKTQNIRGAIQDIIPLAQVDPTILDNIDMDTIVRELWDVHGAPSKGLRTQDQVLALRQQKAEQIEQAQGADMIERAADVVPKISKPVEPDSPLALLMGQGNQ